MSKILIDNIDVLSTLENDINTSLKFNASSYKNNIGAITNSEPVDSAAHSNTATTLKNDSGVSAGSFGPSSNVTIESGGFTNNILIPYFTVNSEGIITSIGNRTLTVTTGCDNCAVYSECSNCTKCTVCSRCSYNCNRCSNCSQSP